jgi:hypothetical protein
VKYLRCDELIFGVLCGIKLYYFKLNSLLTILYQIFSYGKKYIGVHYLVSFLANITGIKSIFRVIRLVPLQTNAALEKLPANFALEQLPPARRSRVTHYVILQDTKIQKRCTAHVAGVWTLVQLLVLLFFPLVFKDDIAKFAPMRFALVGL